MNRVARLFIAAPLLFGAACGLGEGSEFDGGRSRADASVAVDAGKPKDAGTDAKDAGSYPRDAGGQVVPNGADAGRDAGQDSPPGQDAGSSGPIRSAGCGALNAPKSGSYTINVDGTERKYVIDVPTNYDPNQAYRLIFAWHGNGGNGKDIADHGFYDVKAQAGGSAIFVAGDGINAGWANDNGRDLKFVRAMVDQFSSKLCIDKSRIFSTGWSFGGMFSFSLGCGMGDVIRAIAPMSGALWGSGCASGTHPVAAWINHGIYDSLVNVQSGKDGRDEFLRRNHCGTTTVRTDPSPCVVYQGCDPGYPVVWCEWVGPHGTPDYQGTAIWSFFSQF